MNKNLKTEALCLTQTLSIEVSTFYSNGKLEMSLTQ